MKTNLCRNLIFMFTTFILVKNRIYVHQSMAGIPNIFIAEAWPVYDRCVETMGRDSIKEL